MPATSASLPGDTSTTSKVRLLMMVLLPLEKDLEWF
jgi:hypothetical protein